MPDLFDEVGPGPLELVREMRTSLRDGGEVDLTVAQIKAVLRVIRREADRRAAVALHFQEEVRRGLVAIL